MRSDKYHASGRSAKSPPQHGAVGRGVWVLIFVGVLAAGAGSYFVFNRAEPEDITGGTAEAVGAEKAAAKAPPAGERRPSVTARHEQAPVTLPVVQGSLLDDFAGRTYARELLEDLREKKPTDGKFPVTRIKGSTVTAIGQGPQGQPIEVTVDESVPVVQQNQRNDE